MPETKPVYTKEMHERGELPQVGSEVVIRYNFDSKTVTHRGEVLFISNTNIILCKDGHDTHYHTCDYIIEPIPTIEDELVDDIVDHFNYEFGHCKDLAVKLIDKYNITPKGGK